MAFCYSNLEGYAQIPFQESRQIKYPKINPSESTLSKVSVFTKTLCKKETHEKRPTTGKRRTESISQSVRFDITGTKNSRLGQNDVG